VLDCGLLSRGGRLASPTEGSGSSSAVERQLPKLDVTGSIPVSRSKTFKVPALTVALVVSSHLKEFVNRRSTTLNLSCIAFYSACQAELLF
jgi:hypothetical protein